MKKLLFLLAALPLLCNAQNARFSEKDLLKVKVDMLTASSKIILGKTQKEDKTIELFESKIDTLNNALIKENKEEIKELYKEGYSYKHPFVDGSDIPSLYTYNSGKLLIVNSFCSNSIYNENQLNRNQAAKKIVDDICIPIICEIDEIKFKNIQYIGLMVAFSTKDFTEKYATGTHYSLLMVVSVSDLNKFAKCQITEQELYAKGDFYLCDYELRRIEVKP